MGYQTSRIVMNRTSRKYSALFQVTLSNMHHAKAVYNSTLFHIRNLFTGLQKEEAAITSNEREVLDRVFRALGEINEKRKAKGREPYALPDRDCPYLSRYLWISVMNRILKEICPRTEGFYSKLEQQVVSAACRSMKSFTQSLKDFQKHPEKYLGRPHLPRYLKNDTFTLDYDSQMAGPGGTGKRHWLVLAGTDAILPTGKRRYEDIVSVRLSWQNGRIVVSICRKTEDEATPDLDENRMIGIDPGVDNFLAVCPGFGEEPFLIRGGILKSVNQYYNKERAELQGKLKKGEDRYRSRRLDRLTAGREDFLYNFFHQASATIVNYALRERAGTIVVGKNTGWKQESSLGKQENQNFVFIPHARFLRMLKDKAEKYGIRVVFQEESYTSRASAPDRDPVPTYGKEKPGTESVFSGRRTKRGSYLTSDGRMLNADVNGAANIIRKYRESGLQKDTEYLFGKIKVYKVV